MKTRLFYLFLGAIALGLTSCNTYTNNDCQSTTHVHTHRVVLDLQINQDEWAYSNTDNNNYFYATFNVEQLTNEVYNNGEVNVYREYDTGTDKATQAQLPQTRYVEYLVNDSTQTWGFYCEHVDYEYSTGTITIFYTASDFDYELNTQFVPDAMHFRAVLLW